MVLSFTVDGSKWWRTDYEGLVSGDVLLWVTVSKDNERTVHINAFIDHRPKFAEANKAVHRRLLSLMNLPERLLDVALNCRGLAHMTYGEFTTWTQKANLHKPVH